MKCITNYSAKIKQTLSSYSNKCYSNKNKLTIKLVRKILVLNRLDSSKVQHFNIVSI